MKYYQKSEQDSDGSLKLYNKLSKTDRKISNKYFVKIKDKDNHFFYVTRSRNGVSVYKLSEMGKLLQKRVFIS